MQLYTADRVLTQNAAGGIDGGAVLVDGAEITWVGRAADFPTTSFPADLATTTLGDVTIMPGLVDAHVHLAFDGSRTPVARMISESDALQVALMLRSARDLLSVGVTTARDLGARGYLDVAVRTAIQAGTARGPRLLTAGAPITPTGGHCWFMGGEADSVDDVRRLVRQHHKAGVDVIKVMSTGGFMTEGSAPWYAQFTVVELRAIVEEAHRVGKRVAAHAHGVEGIDRALTAGVDTLEHCTFVHDDGRHEVVGELADRIAASATYVSPTLSFAAPQLVELTEGRWQPSVGDLYARGCKIIASTDAGIDNTPHHGFPGALTALVQFGLPPAEVITAATSRAADALGLGAVTGRLAPGLAADLIAVGGDPRIDVAAIADLRLVVARGTEFTPDPLPPLPELDRSMLPPSLFHPTGSDPALQHPPPWSSGTVSDAGT